MKRFVAIVAFLAAFLCFPFQVQASDDLTIHFFDVGKGDCILIQQGGHNVMIDTGYEETIDNVLPELKKRFGVERLDYLLMSHFDKDHVGGAERLISSIPIGSVYQPDYEKQSRYMKQYKSAIAAAGIKPVMVTNTIKLDLGELHFTLFPPLVYKGIVSNDFSVITLLDFRGQKFLFMGDALDKRMEYFLEKQWRGKVDLMKLPHHGLRISRSKEFKDIYAAVKPNFAIITDSKKYRASGALDLMFKFDSVKAFRQRNGAITVHSNGKEIKVTQ